MDAQAIVNTIGSLLMSSEDDRITGKNQSLYAEPLDKVFTPYRRPIRRTLRHTGMPLRRLWAGLSCQSADRSPLRHVGMPLRYLWAGSPCRRPVRASVSCRSWTGRLAVRHTGMPLKYLWAGSPYQSAYRSPLRHARMPLRCL